MRADAIKLSFCVAYDWKFLKFSLPLVYPYADQICLAIDKDRISWAGKPFEFDEDGFRSLIESIDKDHKIKIYEDDFHQQNLTPMENEIRQRKLMSSFMGEGTAWHLQLDSDEYFLNFKDFVQYLKNLKPKRPVNVCCPWITMYKQLDEGFLMIQQEKFKQIEFIPIATNAPLYHHGRRNGHFNHFVNFPILHQSWARSREEVLQKLNNWGHNLDFDIPKYYQFWDSLGKENYSEIKNFHPFRPEEWSSLQLIPAQSIQDLLDNYQANHAFPQFKLNIRLKNSIWYSRLKKIMR